MTLYHDAWLCTNEAETWNWRDTTGKGPHRGYDRRDSFSELEDLGRKRPDRMIGNLNEIREMIGAYPNGNTTRALHIDTLNQLTYCFGHKLRTPGRLEGEKKI